MATATILQLKQAIGLTGSEPLEAVQSGSSVRVTAAQIAALAVGITGVTRVAVAIPAGGANNDYTASGLMGPLIGFLDLEANGNCSITGIQSGIDGQILVITNLSTYMVVLNALNSGSVSANQFRMPVDFTLLQNASKSFKYSATIGKWVSL